MYGFHFDLKRKIIAIPQHKYDELVDGITKLIQCGWATGAALESICGKIMHWSQIRKPAKVLCNRLMRFIHEHIRSNKHLRHRTFEIPDCLKIDMMFWLRYSSMLRVATMESIVFSPSISVTAATDASDFGAGFSVGAAWGSYLFRTTPNKYGAVHRTLSINLKEAHAVLTMIQSLRHELTGRKIMLFIDNTAVMFSLFKHWAGSLQLMRYIQEITLLMCEYHIQLYVEYVASSMNSIADSLSRLDFQRFHETVDLFGLTMDDKPTKVEYYEGLHLLHGDLTHLNRLS